MDTMLLNGLNKRILRTGQGLVCLAKVRVGQVRGEERQISRVKANWRKCCFYLHLKHEPRSINSINCNPTPPVP